MVDLSRLSLDVVITFLLLKNCVSMTTKEHSVRIGSKKNSTENLDARRHQSKRKYDWIGSRYEWRKMTRELNSALRNCNKVSWADVHHSSFENQVLPSKWTPEKCMKVIITNYALLCEKKRRIVRDAGERTKFRRSRCRMRSQRKRVRSRSRRTRAARSRCRKVRKIQHGQCKAFQRKIKKIRGPEPQLLRSLERKQNQQPILEATLMCGTQLPRIYNPQTHTCCYGEIYPYTSDTVCCNRTTVQLSQFLCCNEHVHARLSAEIQCCGDNIYNSTALDCCGGRTVEPKATDEICCGSDKVNASTHFCYDGESYERFPAEASVPTTPGGEGLTATTSFNTADNIYIEVTLSADDSTEVNEEEEEAGAPDAHQGSKATHSGMLVVYIGLGVAVIVIVVLLLIRKRPFLKRKRNESLRWGHECVNPCSSPALEIPEPQSDSSRPTMLLDYHEDNRERHLPLKSGCESGYFSDMICNTIEMPAEKTEQKNCVRSKENFKTNETKATIVKCPSIHSFEQSIVIDLNDIKKKTIVPDKNLTKNLRRDTMTQTYPIKYQKTNIPDSFGNPFVFHEVMSKNRRVVKLNDSDVAMVLPERDLADHDITCHASSFSNIPAIRHKLGLPTTESIASPMVEYHLQGVEKLQDFAVIQMPYIGELGNLQVFRMLSDQGVNEVADKIEVPCKSEMDTDLDTFYIPDVQCKIIRIYTRVFSWYGCTTCGNDHKLSLTADLYCGIENNDDRVDIILFILEELLQMKDYAKTIRQDEESRGRRFLEGNMNIHLPQRVSVDDELKLHISLQDDRWRHPTDDQNPDYDPNVEIVPLYQIVQCPSNTGIPYKCIWNLERKPGTRPERIKCFVYIDFCSNPTEGTPREGIRKQKPTRVFVNQSLGHQVQDTVRKILTVTSKLDPSVIESLSRELKGSLSIKESSLEHILTALQTKFSHDAFAERLALACSKVELLKELDLLVDLKIVPGSLKPKFEQNVRSELDMSPPSSFNKHVNESNGHGRPSYLQNPEPEIERAMSGSFERRNEVPLRWPLNPSETDHDGNNQI